jgi:hypothetical protein
MNPDPSVFLDACDAIDVASPEIHPVASKLRRGNDISTAKQCFEFVRDEIKHSSDFGLNPVTCRASEVLTHGTGFCYAKSHLLCAILRANRIPAGLCYQRLARDHDKSSFCLHGLNAVYLPDIGWYRIDCRGNRDDVDAQFDPPTEHLAFAANLDGECDFPEIHVSPLPEVVRCLTTCQTWEEVLANLPDVQSG